MKWINVSCPLILLFHICTGSVSQPTWADESSPWKATPSTELLQLLEDVHEQYGPDTVSLLGLLLHTTNHSGSVLTASVRVNGPEKRANSTFLSFQVETGLIFNTTTTDQATRLSTLWKKILAESFARLKTLHVPADGVTVSLHYYHRPYGDLEDESDLTDEPGTAEEAKFYFKGEQLQAFLGNTLPAQDLISHSLILVNNTPVVLVLPQEKTEDDERE
jgi:hypothetical protein